MCSRRSETGLSGSGAEGYIHRLTLSSADYKNLLVFMPIGQIERMISSLSPFAA
jgi:hypothetical protein